ncbi:MAG: adenylate kinase [Promicromonosporaceae bacterium]|nr:adenylate kinase [Promicromonosporaceae bacterium]
MGPQGSGKGTQAARLAEHLGMPAISTGDLFRANILLFTEFGVQAQSYINRGELVPDYVTNAMLRDRLLKEDVKGGFVLDGYPRTAGQVRDLDDMVAEFGWTLNGVIYLRVDTEAVTERMEHRAIVQGRSDDTPELIAKRLRIYAEQTAPLVDEYRERGLLVEVDAMGDVPEITNRVLAGIGLNWLANTV